MRIRGTRRRFSVNPLQAIHMPHFPAVSLPSLARAFALSKRQRFVISVFFILTPMLFIFEQTLGKSGVYVSFLLGILTDILLYWAIHKDAKDNISPQVFILPFLFSLASGLFFFLVPTRYITRLIVTFLYAIGLYSLFLSENIFTVATIRTIALLAGARIVSFVISLVSYFFLSTTLFSLHLPIYFASPIFFTFSFLLVLQCLWTVGLQKRIEKSLLFWVAGLTLCLCEMAFVLGYWPSTPTVIALFLTGLFYTLVGSSQVWLERRFFRGVMWEYIWVAIAVMSVLIIFTPWTG